VGSGRRIRPPRKGTPTHDRRSSSAVEWPILAAKKKGTGVRGASRVLSIGYERRSRADFLAILRRERVRRVVDVRAVALSRRSDFRKTALEAALHSARITYLHVPEAGNPYRGDKDDRARCLAAFARHLKRTPAALAVLRATIRKVGVTAVLCYERAHDECHRSVLLQALQDEHGGIEVRQAE
jgi:uncharacterized protein (DUF488 family)